MFKMQCKERMNIIFSDCNGDDDEALGEEEHSCLNVFLDFKFTSGGTIILSFIMLLLNAFCYFSCKSSTKCLYDKRCVLKCLKQPRPN